MSLADLDERPWFVFQLPGGVSYAPGATEEDARKVIVRNSYDKAPVHAWPCIGSRFTSRELLAKELVRKAAQRQSPAQKDGNG